MRISSTHRPRSQGNNRLQASPTTAVSAYIDGKSDHIEAMKLDAVARFRQAQENSHQDLSVLLDGQRHSTKSDILKFGILGIAPAAAVTALGYTMGGAMGAILGGVTGLAIAALPATFFVHRASKAREWKSESRLALPGKSEPTPTAKPGPERLRSLVQQNKAAHPDARQVLFLSGHGDRVNVAHMKIEELGKTMKGNPVDATLLDACLTGQLEVLTHLAPWAGFVMTSPHKIRARGLELPEIFSPKTLKEPDLRTAVVQMASEARSTTPSFAAIDTKVFQKEFLPALDKLGHALKQSNQKDLIKGAMADSLSTDGLFSRRIDMGSFLAELKSSKLCPESTAEAREAFNSTVVFQKNEHSFSFDLKAGQTDESVPDGWREFLKDMNLSFKPWF